MAVLAAIAGGVWLRRSRERSARAARETMTKGMATLLDRSCLNCHGPEKQNGDLRLDSMEAMLKGGKSGPVLVPGDPDNSLLLKLIRHTDPKREMPPKGKLPDSRIALVQSWIKAGAPRPAGFPEVMRDKKTVAQVGNAWSDPKNPIVKIFGGKRLDLWSLKPLAETEPPAVKAKDWVRNPIDAFVLAKMEGQGVTPAPEEDRRALARRLYFDLTGLPPSPEEMDEYMQDHSEKAYEKLIGKLLESPRYGEHWARLWLDVVRYSDSNGFDYDEFRPQAWRFRDYVIRSLNADKPYDRFVTEQLAGDEMVEGAPRNQEEQDCLTATGYLRVGPYDNSAAKFGDKDLCRAQVMADVVETTAAAFMGLTFSCCRCHDHKIDPVSQADYYRIRACFEGVAANDKVLLDLAPEQKTINRELAVIDAERDKLAAIREAAGERVRQGKISNLAKEGRDLLAMAPNDYTPEIKIKVKNLRKGVEPTDDEIKAAYTDEEKQAKSEIEAKIGELERRRSPYTPGFVATDAALYPPKTHLLVKGDLTQPRESVDPGVLSVLDPNPLPPAKTVRVRTPGRRTALAAWLTSKTHPLTARVMVNRIWQGHFESGLQATPNDFGFAGARPTHPELLDWLAREFMDQGWSLKKLHRLIVESATYRQGFVPSSMANKALIQGQRPHRLTAEELRDSILSVTGRLLPQQGGPPLWPELPEEILSSNPGLLVENEEKTRGWYPSPKDKVNVRSIYLVQKRSLRLPILETFDQPENSLSCGRRNVSTVAPEALTLLNSPFATEMAQAFAERLQKEAGETPESKVQRAFALALQRQPDSDEKASCVAFLRDHSLPEFCRAVLNLNEFSYVD